MRAKTIFAAMLGLAILGLQACFFESPYGSQSQYGQYGSGHTICDVQGNNCLACDSGNNNCQRTDGQYGSSGQYGASGQSGSGHSWGFFF